LLRTPGATDKSHSSLNQVVNEGNAPHPNPASISGGGSGESLPLPEATSMDGIVMSGAITGSSSKPGSKVNTPSKEKSEADASLGNA
jgi:hypothetical protein